MTDNRLRNTEDIIGHDVVLKYDNYGGTYRGELYARNAGWWIQRKNGEDVYVQKTQGFSLTHNPARCRLCKMIREETNAT